MCADILVGTCGWGDHQDFYPPELLKSSRHRDKLSYYSRFFPLVEIDTTFYGIPPPSTAAGWVDRTPERFRFNVKAYRSLTRHERVAGHPRPPTSEEEHDFLDLLAPLRDSGKLVAIHYQFPSWFTNTPQARDVLVETRERHPQDVVAIEFRHRSWFDEGAWPATAEVLSELDATFVGVDAPQLGSGTAPPFLAVTSPRLAVARFHGRNRERWYTRGKTSADRFDYLYSPAELAAWVDPLRAASRAGVPVHVLMNNNRSTRPWSTPSTSPLCWTCGCPGLRRRSGPPWRAGTAGFRPGLTPLPTRTPIPARIKPASRCKINRSAHARGAGEPRQGGAGQFETRFRSHDPTVRLVGRHRYSRRFAMAMASPRHNDRSTKRSAPSGMLLRNEAGTHEVEVSRALTQWAVTVTALPDQRHICQDFFARRWEAIARAEDFVRLLNRTEPPPGW